jgi:hypothetical protein
LLLTLRSLYTGSLGVTQPGGVGTLSASAVSYTFAEIATLFPTDFSELGLGNRAYQSAVDVQIGDATTGTAQTTLEDVDCQVSFNAGKSLSTRTTQATSWNVKLGQKIGTGNQATGKRGVALFFKNISGTKNVTWRGTVKLYGCTITAKVDGGAMSFQTPVQTAGASEIVNCIVNGFSSYIFGSSGFNINNLYNLDITGDSTGSNITSLFVNTAERITVGGSPAVAHLQTATAGISIKDVRLFGTPALSDFRWTAPSASNWALVRPAFSNNAAKFGGTGPATAALGAHEYWIYDVKCVDASGAGVAGIPVRLTDVLGDVHVDTTTDSAGEITFGSGVTENAVIVMDHYTDGTYVQSPRWPFYSEINLPSQTGYNDAYYSHRYYWNWPGSETVTLTAGSFEDVGDTVQMEAAAGSGGAIWVERIVP